MSGAPRPPCVPVCWTLLWLVIAACGGDEAARTTGSLDVAEDTLVEDGDVAAEDALLADSALDTDGPLDVWANDGSDGGEPDADALPGDADALPGDADALPIEVEVAVPCEPITDEGCASWETCTWASPDAEEPTCQPGGPGAPGDACSPDAGCSKGVCLDLNGMGSLCHALCESAADCLEEAACLAFEELPFAVCEQWPNDAVCALLDPTDCPEGRGCYMVGDQADPVCLVAGDGLAGEPCETANGCVVGGACVEGVCRTLCDPAVEAPCVGALQTCTLYFQGAGICQD